MASFDQIPLSSSAGMISTGAVLYLNRPALVAAIVPLSSNVEVQVRPRAAAVVVRGVTAQSPDVALRESVEHAQRALDLLAIRGTASLALADPDAKHIVFWTASGTRRMRVWSVSPLYFTFRVEAHAVGQASTPFPQNAWHESYRYFRHSQTTDDLFDAFRNLYLALESVLGHIAAQQATPKGLLDRVRAFLLRQNVGVRWESERQWLRRALNAAHSRVPLEPFMRKGTKATNAPKKLAEDLRKARNKVFHAKHGLAAHLPYDAAARETISDVLGRAARLYVALVGDSFGIGFATGGMTHAAFDSMKQAVVSDVVHVTDDASRATDSDTVVNPAGGRQLALKSWHDTSFDAPFFTLIRGEVPAADVTANVGVIRRVATTHNGALGMFDTLEGALSLDGVDVVEVLFGVRAFNTQTLKPRYST